MNTSDYQHPRVQWPPVIWLLLILSGGLMTSLLRAPHLLSTATRMIVLAHMLGGAVLAAIAIARLMIAQAPRRAWGAVLVAGTVFCGWLAHQTFAPLMAAGHAALAAFALVAITKFSTGTPEDSSPPAPTWTVILARAGFALTFAQVAAGAALRQHLIGLTWHLLIGGLTAIAVLGAAVAMIYRQNTTARVRLAARVAVGAVLVQVSLGVAILFMILISLPDAGAWIILTVAHVVVGSITLLSVGRFAHVLRCQPAPGRQGRPATRA